MAIQGVSKLETPNFGGTNWATSPQEYSPEVKDYLARLDAEAAKRGEGYYNPLIVQGEMNNGDASMPAYATDSYLRQFIDQPIEQNLGYAYAPTGKWGGTGLVSAGPGTNIVLMDDKTGEIVYSGTGFEGAQEAQRRVDAMGGKAPWSIYAAPEGTDDYYRWAQNEPQQSFVSGLGQLIATVGPVVAGAALAPVASGIGVTAAGALVPTAATAGATLGTQMAVQAAIAAGGGALQGKSISKIAFDAAKAAGLTWAAGTYGDDLMKAAGLKTTTPTIPGAGAGSVAGSADEIVINGIKNTGVGIGGAANSGTDVLRGGAGDDVLNTTGEDIVVSGNRPISVTGPATALGNSFLDNIDFNDLSPEERDQIVDIKSKPPEEKPITAPPIVLNPFDPAVDTLDQPSTPIDTSQKPEIKKESVLDKLSALSLADKIKLAQGVIGLGSSIFSGGGDKDGDTPAGYGGNTSPVDYDAAVASGRRRQRPSTFDPFTYGQPQGNQPGQFQFFEHYADGGRIDTKAPRKRKSDIAELVEALLKRRELGPLSISPQWNDVDIGVDQGIGDVLASAHTRLRGGTDYNVNAPLAGGRVGLHARANQYRPDTVGIGYEHPLFGGNIGVGVDRSPGGTSGRVGYTRGFAEGGEPTLLDRAAQAYPFVKQYSPVILQGEGEGDSETWRAGEPGDKAHPRPGGAPIDKLAVEFYGNPSEQGLAGELMHVDAKANATRETLRRTMTHEQIERLKRESGDYVMSIQRGMSEEAAINNALDGAVRGYVIGQWPEDANQRMGYDKKQRKALDDLKKYVTGAPAKAEGGGIGDAQDHARAYAQGGGHDGAGPVAGIGGGQEDKIPAWLSDGEYVWSAQDVSDLGDGSTNEGVRRLDKMRAQVRRQAGRKDVKKIAKPQAGIGDLMAGAV